MSHGAGGADKCEPNLVPLLDMVLQLVMFFMICANFVMEQVNESIKLPEAIAAKPLDKRAERIIFLNVNKEGTVLLSKVDQIGNQSELTNALQVQRYMERRYREDMLGAKSEKDEAKSVIIIRADQETPFEKVHGIMTACSKAGYKKIQLRAMVTNG